MKELVLFRHAKSSWKGPSTGDIARPLSRRGRRTAARMAGWLAATGFRPDIVLCSTSARTRETYSFVRESLGNPEVLYERALYLASATGLLQRLRELSAKTRSVMLIGHNPGLQNLALLLLGNRSAATRARIKTKFPTAALVHFKITAAGWNDIGRRTARLRDCVYPQDLDP